MNMKEILSLAAIIVTVSADAGYFWHYADPHVDPEYGTQGRDSCAAGPPPHPLGDYRCDSPFRLVRSSISAMRQLYPNPDFIVWTGDDVPHVNESLLTVNTSLGIVKNLTLEIQSSFPGIPFYPIMGNHDYLPKSQLPPHPNPIYEAISQFWNGSFPNTQEKERFKMGGYYSVSLSPALRLVLLNTNLYYYPNRAVNASDPDPAGQLAWLQQLGQDAERDGQQLLVAAHIPPGMYEKYPHVAWMKPERNNPLSDALANIDNLQGGLFAHHHTNTFRVLRDKNGNPSCTLLVTPGVTPWASTFPGNFGSASRNPGLRLIKYDRQTGKLLDYTQYYTNLEANQKAGAYNWTELYTASQAYGLKDLSPAEMKRLADEMRTNKEKFEKYLLYNGLGMKKDLECDVTCRSVHLCGMEEIEEDQFSTCKEELTSFGQQLNYDLALLGLMLLQVLLTLPFGL